MHFCPTIEVLLPPDAQLQRAPEMLNRRTSQLLSETGPTSSLCECPFAF